MRVHMSVCECARARVCICCVSERGCISKACSGIKPSNRSNIIENEKINKDLARARGTRFRKSRYSRPPCSTSTLLEKERSMYKSKFESTAREIEWQDNVIGFLSVCYSLSDLPEEKSVLCVLSPIPLNE